MENENFTFHEQSESLEQQKTKYENIQPLDMGPTNEVISKIRLDEIFDIFGDNSDESLTQDDKKEIEGLINQLTNGKTDKNNTLLDIASFIKSFGEGITKEDFIDDIKERIADKQISSTEQQKLENNTAEHTDVNKESSRQENIKTLISSLNTLLPADNSKPYKHLLDQLQTIDPNNPWTQFDEILAQLNNQDTFLSLTIDLQQKDQQNGTHNFETFKASIISLDPSFRDKFTQAETNAKLALGTDNLNNTTITSNGYKQNTPDGFTTSATLDGKDRDISRTDSNYKLKSNLDTTTAQQEADRITTSLAEALKPLDKSLASIKAMKVHLDEAKRQGTSLDTLKSELQALDPELYNQLGLDFLNSSDELTNRLTSHETELTNRKAELQAQADKARNQLIYNQKTKAEQKDIHKKETLNFIHQIRFDSLPQATTDTIIANINQAPNNYGLTQRIDFENGSLGFDTDFGNQEISQGEKQKFIELYNKILTGSKEFPIKLTDGNITFHDTAENATASIPANAMFDIGEFANRSLGLDPVFRAMENLDKIEE